MSAFPSPTLTVGAAPRAPRASEEPATVAYQRQNRIALKHCAEGRRPISLHQRSAASGIGNPLICLCNRKYVQGLFAALFLFVQCLLCAR